MRNLTATLFTLALIGCGPEPLLDEEETSDPVNPSFFEFSAAATPRCGAPLASFQGTTAYSNGANTGTGVSCAGQGAYGYRYQCVELVMRHFKTKWNLRWWGNAKDLLNNAPRNAVDVYSNGDRAHPPRPGDLIVWPNGQWGHTALVTAVRANAVDIIEQNVRGSNGRATLPYVGARIGARWGGWVPQGWAHAKANR
jgi:surface antigen